jgi:hypothetical protein
VAAEAGFLRRMDGLIEFSKERAQRCRADIDADRREAVEPVVLESALETARVTADLLHTLGVLTAKTTGSATLSGRVGMPKIEHSSMSRLPAKVMLLGTVFSTLTEPDGSFSFRHLPPGEYRLVVSVPGEVSGVQLVNLAAGTPVMLDPIDLSHGADGNLVRNPTLALRWVSPDGFDNWMLHPPPARLAAKTAMRDWEGDWIPLQPGMSYRLTVRWRRNTDSANESQILFRTKSDPDFQTPATEYQAVASGTNEAVIVGSPEAAWVQVCIRTPQSPDTVLDSISLRLMP